TGPAGGGRAVARRVRGGRKVRTPQGRVAANGGPERSGGSGTERRRPRAARRGGTGERGGKSSPAPPGRAGLGKPHPEQDRAEGGPVARPGADGPSVPSGRSLDLPGNRGARRMAAAPASWAGGQNPA